ncbi:uncharacterized protein G2W53_039312 [Senna tora]|uniref:Protein NO VEIN C-terminal domain-containing protein n=1 Tax=Senna tora TaxID=362788 RepID=A0A834SPD3_9FABA|nr:uncharacterized protein G2W53_039312 [Senna tora]
MILVSNVTLVHYVQVVTREAIYHGIADCSVKTSLINWVLPYAQRYVHKRHNDKYVKLKQSGFDVLNHLKVIVVEKLYYRNVIKSCGSVSKKRVECSCLLQENILYTTQESDHHSLFMELSRLLFDGTPELHFANFLHMITTMVESGSSMEQVEFFISTSQNVPKLLNEGSVWALSLSSLMDNDNLQLPDHFPLTNEQFFSLPDHVPLTNEQIFSRRKTVNTKWPPADWKTAPDFNYARAYGFKTQAAQTSSCIETKNDEFEIVKSTPVCADPESIATDWTIKDEAAAGSVSLVLRESVNMEGQSSQDCYQTAFDLHTESRSVTLAEALDEPSSSSPAFSRRDKLQTGTFDAAQARVTGRLGELLACKYYVGKVGKASVKWVNEVNETGLPYDLVIGHETSKEFIEVKATRSPKKDWFIITMREWQFAFEKGDSFSIAHVALMRDNVAKITIFKNPVRLCQLGELQLAVMMPRQQQQQEFSIVS